MYVFYFRGNVKDWQKEEREELLAEYKFWSVPSGFQELGERERAGHPLGGWIER